MGTSGWEAGDRKKSREGMQVEADGIEGDSGEQATDTGHCEQRKKKARPTPEVLTQGNFSPMPRAQGALDGFCPGCVESEGILVPRQ